MFQCVDCHMVLKYLLNTKLIKLKNNLRIFFTKAGKIKL